MIVLKYDYGQDLAETSLWGAVVELSNRGDRAKFLFCSLENLQAARRCVAGNKLKAIQIIPLPSSMLVHRDAWALSGSEHTFWSPGVK